MITDTKKYISISEFIKKAKQLGINLGRGNPHHRIRYYIKTGLLPHQVRLKQASTTHNIRNTVGHLPVYALALLAKIELLKSQKKSSLVIKQIIGKERLVYETANLDGSFSTKNFSQDLLSKFITLASLILLIVVAVNFAKENPPTTSQQALNDKDQVVAIPKQIIIPVETIYIDSASHEILSPSNGYRIGLQNLSPKRILLTGQNEIIDESGNIISTGVLGTSQEQINQTTGTSVMRANTTSIQVPTQFVRKSSRILLTPRSKTQNQNLIVSEVKDGYYFTVELETPLNNDILFDWMVVN